MGTTDFTGDGGGYAPCSVLSASPLVCFYRRLNVADIIANDTTMTSNEYIAADDVVQVLDIPIGFVFNKAILRVITACTATVTVAVGLGSGEEAVAAMATGTAGVMTSTVEGDSWAGGKCFYAADTIDVQYITANCVVGEAELFVLGHMIVLGTA